MATINGTALNDNIIGTSGDDVIVGLDGNDTLSGGSGFDQLFGGNSDDILIDDADGGLFEGGAGNDQLIGSTSLSDTALYTFYNHASSVTFVSTFVPGAATSTQADGLGGIDTLSNIDRVDILGSQHGDNLTGDAGANSIYGYAGNDTLSGAAGNDYLNGDDGDDTAVFSGMTAEYSVTYQSATAEYTITDSQAGRDGTDILSEIENLKFSDGIRTPASLLQGNVPTYILVPSATSVNEGASLIYTLNTTNVAAGTVLNYTLSGVSAADIVGGALTGSVTVASTGMTTFTVALVADSLTEGAETLVAKVGSTSGVALATASSVVVNDTSLPTTRIFLGSGNTFTAGDMNLKVTGAAGTKTDTVHINAGISGIQMDGNIERVEVPGTLSDYSFLTVAGTGVQIQSVSSGTVIATIPSLNQNATLAFANGSAALVQTGSSSFSLGGLAIGTGSASSFVTSSLSGFNGADTSTLGTLPGTATTRAFIGSGNTFTVGDSNISVTGASGSATDTLRIQAGVTGTKMDGNIERVELSGSLSDFKFMTVNGMGTQIQLASSGAVVATIPSLNQNAVLAFTNGSASLMQTGSSAFSLGGQPIGTTSASSFTTGGLTGFNGADVSTLGAGSIVVGTPPSSYNSWTTDTDNSGTYTAGDKISIVFSKLLKSTLLITDISVDNESTLGVGANIAFVATDNFGHPEYEITLGTGATISAASTVISVNKTAVIAGDGGSPSTNIQFYPNLLHNVTMNDIDTDGLYSAGDKIVITYSNPISNVNIGNVSWDLGSYPNTSLGVGANIMPLNDNNGSATQYEITLGTGGVLIPGMLLWISNISFGIFSGTEGIVVPAVQTPSAVSLNSVAALSSESDLFVKLLGTTGLGNVGALTVSDYFA